MYRAESGRIQSAVRLLVRAPWVRAALDCVAHWSRRRAIHVPAGQDAVLVLGDHHVSRQNTNTGRLTAAMFDAALATALDLARAPDRTGDR